MTEPLETPPPRLMDVKQLSRYASLPVATIRTWVCTGRIPSRCIRRAGRKLLFELGEINAWISAGFPAETR